MTKKFPAPPVLAALFAARNEKRLPYYCYKLAGAGTQAQYGLDVVFPEQMDVEESSMSVWIPFADGNSRDGVGDLLEVGGIRTDRHRKNPIVLFDHGKEVKLPIALALDPQTKEYTVQLDPVNQVGRLKAFFYDGCGQDGVDRTQDYNHALFCEQLFDLTAKGYIRGGSIGYQVIKALELPPDYSRGIPKGLHLLSTLMLEGSLVVMPANADTVRKGLDFDQLVDFWIKNTVESAKEILAFPNVCGKSLSPYLVKSLEAYTDEKAINWFRGKPTENLGYGVEKFGRTDPHYFVTEGGRQVQGQPEGETSGGHLTSGKPHKTREDAMQSAIRHRESGKGMKAAVPAKPFRKRPGSSAARSGKPPAADSQVNQNTVAGGGSHKPPIQSDSIHDDESEPGDNPYGFKGSRKDMSKKKSAEEIKPAKQNRKVVSGGKGKTRTARVTEDVRGSDDEIKNTRKPTQLKKELETDGEKAAAWEQHYPKTPAKPFPVMPEALGHGDYKAPKRGIVLSTRGTETKREIKRPEGNKYLTVRKKYRKTKSLRRRIKSSKPGSSIVYVGVKEFEKAKKNATEKGLKFQHMGESNGAVKLKLIGDDGTIDSFAKEYGRPLRMGTKSLENKTKDIGENMATKSADEKTTNQNKIRREYGEGAIGDVMGTERGHSGGKTRKAGKKPTKISLQSQIPYGKQKGKAMEDEEMIPEETEMVEDVTEPEPDIEAAAEMDEGMQEPYGAQLLRRLHQDGAILLGEYDDFARLVENERVKKILVSKLETLVDFLEEIESCFGKEYPEAAPLEGAEEMDETESPEEEGLEEEAIEDSTLGDDKDVGLGMDMDDRGQEAVSGDSDMEEGIEGEEPAMPSDEETVETEDEEEEPADGIGMGEKRFKDLRAKYKGGKEEILKGRQNQRPTQKPEMLTSRQRTQLDPMRKKRTAPLEKAMGEVCENCGQANCQCAEEQAPVETQENIQESFRDGLASHEKKAVGEAAGFLSQLSTEQNYGDEHRMNAWHYHKTLDGMVSIAEANDLLNKDPSDQSTDIPPAEWEAGAGAKAVGDINRMRSDVAMDQHRRANPTPGQTSYAGEDRKLPASQQLREITPDMQAEVRAARQAAGNKEMEEMHPSRKMCKDASIFLKALSGTRDFGDPHREQCKYWHRNLEPLSKEEDIDAEDLDLEEDQVEDSEEETEVGERGEKTNQFRKVETGDQFAFDRTEMEPHLQRGMASSGPYRKTGKRTYQDAEGGKYKVGSTKVPTVKTSSGRPTQLKKEFPEINEKALADQIAANQKAMEKLQSMLSSLN